MNPPFDRTAREEFVRRWRPLLCGMALCGLYAELKENALKRGIAAIDIPPEVDRLLGRIYDDALRLFQESQPVESKHGKAS
jgi:hypothetical protein